MLREGQTPTTRTGRTRLRAAAVVAAAAVAVPVVAGGPASAGAGQPTAQAAKSCSTPKYPGVGYFTSLNVYHVSCATGRKLVIAYYKCRTKHGKKGKCSGVMGYRCTEKRVSIPTEFDARVTCKDGSKVVKHTYQQDL
jgi:hypothetical protein